MKTCKFWFMMAAAVVMTCCMAVFTSCGDDEDDYITPHPQGANTLCSSKILNEEMQETTDGEFSGFTKVRLEVLQNRSESGDTLIYRVVKLSHAMQSSFSVKRLTTAEKGRYFYLLDCEMTRDTTEIGTRAIDEFNITQHRVSCILSVKEYESGDLLCEFKVDFDFETAVYDDGVLRYEPSTPRFKECSYEIEHGGFVWQEDGTLELILRFLSGWENTSYVKEQLVRFVYQP